MRQVETGRSAPPSLAEFAGDVAEQPHVAGRFGTESARTLRVELDGGVWLKPGAAIAYRGEIRFERERVLEAPDVGTALLREAAPLVRATGRGSLFCAHRGSHVSTVGLTGESVMVAWPDLLAFEDSLACTPTLVDHGVGIAAGGLVAMQLSGHGAFAIISHGRPLALRVAAGAPVSTDPHATVAWSGRLDVRLKTDITWRSAVNHGGGEPVQMRFDGDGIVFVQPYEDPGRFTIEWNPLQRLAAVITS